MLEYGKERGLCLKKGQLAWIDASLYVVFMGGAGMLRIVKGVANMKVMGNMTERR